jgi:hypothetical protein
LNTKDGVISVSRAERNEQFGAEHMTPDDPVLPECIEHIWEWFWHLHGRRGQGFDSEPPIGYDTITHWMERTGILVTPEEVAMLVEMDDAYLQQVAEEKTAKRERDKTKRTT